MTQRRTVQTFGGPINDYAVSGQQYRTLREHLSGSSRIQERYPAGVKLEDLAGHAAAKRALQVAVAGGHQTLLIGPAGSGKDSLQRAARELGNYAVEVKSSCYCGNYRNVGRECHCSPRALARYSRQVAALAAGYDLIVEVCPVPTKEYIVLASQRGTTEQALSRIAAARDRMGRRGQQGVNVRLESVAELLGQLDGGSGDAAHRTLELVVRRVSLGAGEVVRLLRVARTVADLNGEERISARAVAEAALYRTVAYNWGS